MADSTDNSNDKSKETDIPTALPSSAGTESNANASANASWKIPYGMEDHIESGTLHHVALHWSTSLCVASVFVKV